MTTLRENVTITVVVTTEDGEEIENRTFAPEGDWVTRYNCVKKEDDAENVSFKAVKRPAAMRAARAARAEEN